MNNLKTSGILLVCLLWALACSNKTPDKSSDSFESGRDLSNNSPDTVQKSDTQRFLLLREKITYGQANFAEVREALTDNDIAGLTNTVHALYSMRWHRGVFKLLYEMWDLDRSRFPELNWEQIAREPVRVALASTLNRIQITDTLEYQSYIRSFQDHEHEFVRAQVVVALGFNGDPEDIPYMVAMVKGDNDYVAQSSLAGLGLMNNPEARDALIELGKSLQGTARGKITNEVLRSAYKVKEKKMSSENVSP